MNNNEYNEFVNKIIEKAVDIQNDFNQLSEENKMKFAKEAASFLRQYRIAADVDDILKMTKRQ